MSHYKDNTLAKIGDIVRTKPSHLPYEIQGVVISVLEGTETCNLSIAYPVLTNLGGPAAVLNTTWTTVNAKDVSLHHRD